MTKSDAEIYAQFDDKLQAAMSEAGLKKEDLRYLLGEFEVPGFPDGPPHDLMGAVVGEFVLGSLSSHPETKNPTPWQEANVLVATALRNGELLEDWHAGRRDPALDDPGVSRISDEEMRALMIYTTRRLAFLLFLRDNAPNFYSLFLSGALKMETRKWVTNETDAAKFVDLDPQEEDDVD